MTAFEEESLGNQAKRDFGFQGTKMIDNWGSSKCIYVSVHIHIYIYMLSMYNDRPQKYPFSFLPDGNTSI